MEHYSSPLSLGEMLFVPLLLTCAAVLAAEPSPQVLLSDDAYHFDQWANGQHDENYTEWWYFNLYDEQQALRAIFVYLITDPESRTGFGFAQVTAVAYTGQGIVSENDTYPTGSFSASPAIADVAIDSNTVQVVSDVYEIAGASANGRISWTLQYRRQPDPWFAADRLHVGLLPWERMSWLIWMPRAQVDGQVVVDGQVYSIEAAPGYHDHNWGEWIPFDALWNWAQYSEPGLAFGLGDFIGGPPGLLAIERLGERTVFMKEQYRLLHTQWAFDPENRVDWV